MSCDHQPTQMSDFYKIPALFVGLFILMSNIGPVLV